jgi:amino acid transporter
MLENSSSQNYLDDSKGTDTSVIDEEDPSMLLRTEVRQGSRLGDVRVRLVRPSHSMFRRLDSGLLEATEAAQAPRTGLERFTTGVKRVLIGSPIATIQAEHERLTKFKALAVLSSDAISSVAYATEAILATLIFAGSGNLGYTLLICFAIVALLGIVALSYRQTIPAYPNGGGSYIVAKDNLGTVPGLVAAASLMIDYVLTVSVSISAGVLALATLFSSLQPYVVPIDVALVILITVVNLRGVRESGSVFSIPTYVFIVSAFLLIIVGIVEAFIGNHQPIVGHFHPAAQLEPLTIFLILRAFAAGCSAMTGVEAISNGIPAFKKPEPRNAAITLTWMAVILGSLFIGITILALSFGIEPSANGNPTVIGQLAQTVFHGPLTFMYPVFQISTLFILTLAANTSYSDFPRLSSLLARDHFLPHQFAFRGDRLAFSIGIIVLAILAGLLLVVFHGDTTTLLNLYAVGVFMSFTLSQSGMVRHWWHLRKEQPSAKRSMFINGLGALTTFLVAVVISTTKFFEGAWVVVLLIPLLILMFLGIRSHYLRVERERTTDLPISPKDIQHRLIVPIIELDKAARQSLAYARSISSHVTAVYIKTNTTKVENLDSQWKEWQDSLTEAEQVHLDIIDAEGRSLVRPLLKYITTMREQHTAETVTVILPEVATRSLLAQIFAHSQTFRLKFALFFRPEIIVTNVPWYEQKSNMPARARDIHHRFIVPISELDRATLQSLAYARSISPHVIAVHVAIDPHDIDALHEKWKSLQKYMTKKEETQLIIIESPYRSLTRPLLSYIETVRELHLEETLTVILPEFVVAHWWEYFLHNQTALQLKQALAALPGLVVTDIPQHIQRKTQK